MGKARVYESDINRWGMLFGGVVSAVVCLSLGDPAELELLGLAFYVGFLLAAIMCLTSFFIRMVFSIACDVVAFFVGHHYTKRRHVALCISVLFATVVLGSIIISLDDAVFISFWLLIISFTGYLNILINGDCDNEQRTSEMLESMIDDVENMRRGV